MYLKSISFLLLLVGSFSISARPWNTNSNNFNFEREFIKSTKRNKELNTLFSILKSSDQNYDFPAKLQDLKSQYKDKMSPPNTELTIDLSKITYDKILNSSQEAKEIKGELKTLRANYLKIKVQLKTITLDHVYIDRMNCQEDESKCYNFESTHYWKKYRLAFFDVLNYLIINYDFYLNDEEEFKNNLITDLEIEDKLRETLKDKYHCWKNDCSTPMRNALDQMLVNLAEFVADQKSYQALIQSEKVAIANELGLEVDQIKSTDSFSKDVLGFPKGEFELNYSLSQYTLDNGSMNYSPIVEYLESIRLDDLVKVVK